MKKKEYRIYVDINVTDNFINDYHQYETYLNSGQDSDYFLYFLLSLKQVRISPISTIFRPIK